MTPARKPRAVPDAPRRPAAAAVRGQRGIQSVEVGGRLLLALTHQGRPMALKDLARDAGMTPAKAHPYLVSFGKLGLVTQDDGSGRYGLGPLALQLGLISLQQFDPVRLAAPLLPGLAQTLGHTVALAVWGNRGPTIVRIEEAPSAVHVNMRHGTVVSLRGTASGLLFAALMPREQVLMAMADQWAASLHQRGEPVPARLRVEIEPALEATLTEIRRQRLSRIDGGAVPGVSAMAAPVFDDAGAMVMSFTAIGPTAIFDSAPDGAVARGLERAAREVSVRLGSPAVRTELRG